jgi:bisphosphoglycerate-independent phosphoglycerate mutase (AlkP superfamily)
MHTWGSHFYGKLEVLIELTRKVKFRAEVHGRDDVKLSSNQGRLQTREHMFLHKSIKFISQRFFSMDYNYTDVSSSIHEEIG